MMTPVVFFYFRMVFVGDILRRGGMLIFSPIFLFFLFFYFLLPTFCYVMVRLRDRYCQAVLHSIAKRFAQRKYHQYVSSYFCRIK